MKKSISVLISLLFVFSAFSQSFKEYTHPLLLSFEEVDNDIKHDVNSTLEITDEHFKHLNNSLKWTWNSNSSFWTIQKEIDYKKPASDKDPHVSTFVFWVYSKQAIEAKMKVEFFKDGERACFFEYALDFTGWRGAWLAFDRDMQGQPMEGMDEIRISVPDVDKGTLFFDHFILSSMQDVRYHTADFQAPYINFGTTSHWLVLLESWLQDFDLPLANSTQSEIDGIRQIEQRTRDLLLKNKKPLPLSRLRTNVQSYNITENGDGTVKGIPVFFERYGETYEKFGAERYNIIYNNIMGLRKFNTLLLNLSVAYNTTESASDKKEIGDLFVKMIKHMLDQGFQAGSAMGTLHHLGYSMRDYYSAVFLMADVLKENNLKSQVQQAMEWFAGTGEVKIEPKILGMDVDAFNTNLVARLTSILMIDSYPEKARYLHAFVRWLENGYQYAEGTRGTFKIDGTMFHHRHNYPAYAVGGLSGAVEAVYLLRQTDFRISEQSHENLKKALLAMRIYCNLRTWPLSLSGRHPDGLGQINPYHYELLALSGSPDGKKEIDIEMAEAYLRLADKTTETVDFFVSQGLAPEKSPSGNWTYNYSSLNVHRRDNWMVSAMGHSRYLWSSEGYRGENLFGRYLNHGSLQILATGDPISNEGSGFKQEGWDWNHFPGTTATVLPIAELKADVKSLDDVSGYEEMLLSDESFSGGISIQQKHGAFGMKLHEHDKYNGSLRARKSVFFFDNRIVALGSNIKSALQNETHTTLFQVYLDDVKKTFYVNGRKNQKFPFTKTYAKRLTRLSDGQNNHFFVKNGQVAFRKSMQHSLHEETGMPTSNNYATASINHGSNPKNAKYEYMILVQPGQHEIKDVARKTPYRVLQHDSLAHIVCDTKTQTTGYVIFEAGSLKANDFLLEATIPSLVMTQQIGNNRVILSACDPDLRFYEGPADEIYDQEGKRIERSVYSRTWIDNPSGKSILRIKIAGNWKMEGKNEKVKIIENRENYTTIEFENQHGMSQEIILARN